MVDDESRREAQLVEFALRMPVQLVAAPHPATWPPEALLARCTLRTQRRSGPGGQHRNKTSSGVFLHCQDWDITGEATERRSQAQNREVALSRIRFRLAVQLRSPSIFDTLAEASAAIASRATVEPREAELRQQYYASPLRISDENELKPAVLALLLNDLHAAGGQPSLVAAQWRCSTSAVIGLVHSHSAAFGWLNDLRKFHGRRALKV